jgi:hypothetical protein
MAVLTQRSHVRETTPVDLREYDARALADQPVVRFAAVALFLSPTGWMLGIRCKNLGD